MNIINIFSTTRQIQDSQQTLFIIRHKQNLFQITEEIQTETIM